MSQGNESTDNQQDSNQSDADTVRPSKWKRIRNFLSKSEWVMAFLTLVIALTGVVGIFLVIRGGQDTKKMVRAAHQQACAAGRFAESASDIQKSIAKSEADFSQIEKDSEDSITSTRNEMRQDRRAWVDIAVAPNGPLQIEDDGAFLPLRVVMTNVGKSPAAYVKPVLKLFVGLASPSPEHVAAYCGVLKSPQAAKYKNGWSLFPGEHFEINEPAAASATEVKNGLANKGIPGMIGLSLVVCNDYTLSFDTVHHHQTRKIYAISYPGKDGRFMGAFAPRSTYSTVVLYLQPGSSAD